MSRTVSRVWGTLIPWLLPPAICTGRVSSRGQKPCMQVLVVGSPAHMHKNVTHQKGPVGTQAGCARKHSGAGAGSGSVREGGTGLAIGGIRTPKYAHILIRRPARMSPDRAEGTLQRG